MRISDWSSDVCSSDLFAGEGEEAVRRRAAPLRIARREMVADVAVGKAAKDRVGQRVKRDIGIAMALKSMTMRDFYPADPQIGRTSCRERVGQYVYISVVAVALKKKIKKTT